MRKSILRSLYPHPVPGIYSRDHNWVALKSTWSVFPSESRTELCFIYFVLQPARSVCLFLLATARPTQNSSQETYAQGSNYRPSAIPSISFNFIQNKFSSLSWVHIIVTELHTISRRFMCSKLPYFGFQSEFSYWSFVSLPVAAVPPFQLHETRAHISEFSNFARMPNNATTHAAPSLDR